MNHNHSQGCLGQQQGPDACCGFPASPRTRPLGIAPAVATAEASAAPTFQSAHLRGAPTAVRVTPKHWMDGVRHPQWFSPENRAIVPRSETVAGSACLGCRPPVGRPGRAGGAVARSPAPAPLCTLWACLCDCRLHIPGPPTQEPSGTQSHVWLEALKRPRAPAIPSVGGHVLSPMACGPAPSAVSAVSAQNCPPGC